MRSFLILFAALCLATASDLCADEIPPTMELVLPEANSTVAELKTIEIIFSEPVSGVDAQDLQINGTGATNLIVLTDNQYLFQFKRALAGSAFVGWRSGHEIRDLSSASNLLQSSSWGYTVNPTNSDGVYISEFMASNDKTLTDEDGLGADWIEIYNSTSTLISLNGWSLTDSTNSLQKWKFPDMGLAPKTFLLIFATEKNRTNVTGNLHTNFKLNRDPDYLALVDPAGKVVSAYKYPRQEVDVSFGRNLDDPDRTGYYLEPTPGNYNRTSGAGFAPGVTLSRPGTGFTSPFNLTIRSDDPADTGAVIRYTTDGAVPSESSPVYLEPLRISSSMQVRARAFKPGFFSGPTASEGYSLISQSVAGFKSNLPLIVINNFGKGSFPATVDKFAYLMIHETGTGGKSSITNQPELRTRTGINIRGSSTQGIAKQSFAVEFWDENNFDRDLSPLGMPAESDWVLYAPNFFEPVMIHNPFMFDLSNSIGRYAPRSRFVEVFVNTGAGALSTSHYRGVYVLMEKIKIGKDRVNIDKLSERDLREPDVSGGYLLSVDRRDEGDGGFSAAGQSSLTYIEPKEFEVELPQRDPQEQYIRTYVAQFGTVLNSINYRDPALGYARFIDVYSWIDYHLLNVLALNVDALRLSAYFHKPRGGKLAFGPLWDFDRALGSTDGRDFNPELWRGGGDGTDFFSYTWWRRLFTDIDFWQKYVDRWQVLRDQQFSDAQLFQRIDQLTDILREAQPREAARWGGGDYQNEIDHMRDWLGRRTRFIDSQFLSRPVFSSPSTNINAGFMLSLSAPEGGTIYYTTNGTDPRNPGGSVSAQASTYLSALKFGANVKVAARVFRTSHVNRTGANNPPLSTSWSGLTTATFVLNTPALRVTEIMYHPADLAGSTNSSENFEFVELKNTGDTLLNLTGFRFTNGIHFDFSTGKVSTLAPGDYVLVVKSAGAFASRYGTGLKVAGEYSGNLDNNGERLNLIGPMDEPIHLFSYNKRWYPITDGAGFALTLTDENISPVDLGLATSWRPGTRPGGSPGAKDPIPENISAVWINEILANAAGKISDRVELYNPNTEPVDISGWFLTDDFLNPKKFQIPLPTMLQPGGYVFFTAEHFQTGIVPFSLSALGESIYLFSSSKGELSGYFHGFEFGPTAPNVSLGRFTNSASEEFLLQLWNTSFGSPNSDPQIGPVVITEIFYDPAPVDGTNNNSEEEFVELHNSSAQPVALFQSGNPTNTWHMRGGIEFNFPTNIILPPGGYVLLVNFPPAGLRLNSFRTKYSVPAETFILGPYGGSLGNSDDQIRLERPDAVSPGTGTVPYIELESARYKNSNPWPTNANRTGLSIQRRSDFFIGNEPANWFGAEPTPGKQSNVPAEDRDKDGLPDDWESLHGLNPASAEDMDGAAGDPDEDGATNLDEYRAGTFPKNAASVLKLSQFRSMDNSPPMLRFFPSPAKTYSLLFKENVDSPIWIRLRDFSTSSAGGEITVPLDFSLPSRIFRLVTPALAPP